MLWGAYRSHRTGKVYYRSRVIADRSNDPVMFWVYLTAGSALGALAVGSALIALLTISN